MWLPDTQPALFISLVLLLVSRAFSHRRPALRPLAFAFAGATLALLHAQSQLTKQLDSVQTRTFEAWITDLPQAQPNHASFYAQTNDHLYRLNWYQEQTERPAIEAGAKYLITARIKPPHGNLNPVGFDRERWLFRHGIDGIGTVHQLEQIEAASWHSLDRIRQQIKSEITKTFTDPEVLGSVLALSLGDRSQLDMEQYQNTGTAHLMAISGLHIGLVAGIGWLLGSLVFRLWPNQHWHRLHWQLLFGIGLAAGYAMLAGLSISTQRALIMLVIYAAYQFFRRKANPWDVWSASLIMVLAIDPMNVLDWGFWLSFMAVAILIFGFYNRSDNTTKWRSFFKAQLILLLGLMPLGIWVFGSIKLIAPFANAIAIPIMAMVLIPALIVMLICTLLLGHIPSWLDWIINTCSESLQGFIDWMSQLSWLNWHVSVSSHWEFWVLVAGVILLLAPKAIPQRWLGAFCFLVLFGQNNSEQLPQGHFTARIIDVGQGLAVWVSTQNHHMVYDVGASHESGFNWADTAIIPLLNQHQINHLDALILSHRDNDHAGGQSAMLESIEVDEIYGTETDQQACTTDLKWGWDDVQFEVLSPYNLTPYLKNNSSCVLKISGVDRSLLLTGDIESAVELRLLNQSSKQLAADILVIPHHGSGTSSTAAFIEAVNPATAINSSGRFNPFGHPKPEVMRRYHDSGIPTLDTQTEGMITVNTHPEFSVSSFRADHPRVWRQ